MRHIGATTCFRAGDLVNEEGRVGGGGGGGVQGTELPAPLVLGSTSCSGSMSGSHLEPTLAASWDAPAGQASGSIELRPTVPPPPPGGWTGETWSSLTSCRSCVQTDACALSQSRNWTELSFMCSKLYPSII